MAACCSIIPNDILERLAKDKTLSVADRKGFADTARVDKEIRKLRTQAGKLVSAQSIVGMSAVTLSAAPKITVFNCNQGSSLPGAPVPNPGASPDASAKRCFTQTTAVAMFFQKVFKRNSIDNAGMTLQSSIHYGAKYNNAAWNGSQMIYGDGDGNIFVDFTKGNDVIGHELTHGVTQHTLQLVYANESGGLNESMSDVFGSMFRQWSAKQTVNSADWLIGKDIMGPGATAKGYTCLRDMANPKAKHCLGAQVMHYKDYTPGMDPHYSSGIPNYAFYKAAKAIGGKSWEKTGQVWYSAMTAFGPNPNMKMKVFADRTRKLATQMYPAIPKIRTEIDKAWKQVGL